MTTSEDRSESLPIVFLHGWLSDAADWSPVANTIRGVRVLCPNLVPHAEWEDAIREMASSLPPCVLAGYSMGGRIALAIAVAPDSPVRGLVLVSANPGLEQEQERGPRAARDASQLEKLTDANRASFLDAWFRQPLFQSVDDSMRRRWIDERASLDLARQRDLLRCYGIARQPDFWPRLDTLDIPTLVLTGEHDAKYVEILGRMAARLPDGEAVVMPGTSHAPHREQPALVRSLIESWYARRFRDNSASVAAARPARGGTDADCSKR